MDSLDLSVMKGEIFALLGHNGAGKSTTISMLTGLINPSRGDAFIGGKSIRYEMDGIRKSLGVCPQNDSFWDFLSAFEHVQLFASIKGVESSSIQSECTSLLREVGLSDQDWHRRAKEFSGGMKRKLSLSIAFIGNNNVVFLDECTTGMDPGNFSLSL